MNSQDLEIVSAVAHESNNSFIVVVLKSEETNIITVACVVTAVQFGFVKVVKIYLCHFSISLN
jgi:hypothetical protein